MNNYFFLEEESSTCGCNATRGKEIYELLHPETKQGIAQAIGMNKAISNDVSEIISPTFSEDTAVKTGLTSRTIQQEVQISSNLTPEIKIKIYVLYQVNNYLLRVHFFHLREKSNTQHTRQVKIAKDFNSFVLGHTLASCLILSRHVMTF